MSLENKIKSKARRPRQEVGVYDPMEQAGHSDMISVNYVLQELGVVADKIRSLFNEYYRGSGCNPLFYECEQEILELLVDNSKEKEK